MKIGIIGAGRIGGNCARRFALAGHEVRLSFARDRQRLAALASAVGRGASAGTPAEAASFGDVVVLSVPWGLVDEALAQAGGLEGKIVVDTTNQFGREGPLALPGGQTAAAYNAARMVGTRYTKSFNTLTAAFQAEAAERARADRVVQWLCGDDGDAKTTVAELIEEAGYIPVDLGGTDGCEVMEAPRRAGSVYGEEYRAPDVEVVLGAVRSGRPVPPPPEY